MDIRIEKISDSIEEIRKLTNGLPHQDEIKKRIDAILRSIPGSQSLFSQTSGGVCDGEYLIILDPGIGQKFEVCKFNLWIDDLSKYSNDYILDRILGGLSNLKEKFLAIHNIQIGEKG